MNFAILLKYYISKETSANRSFKKAGLKAKFNDCFVLEC